jgi:hypothetical protein
MHSGNKKYTNNFRKTQWKEMEEFQESWLWKMKCIQLSPEFNGGFQGGEHLGSITEILKE